MSSATHPLYGTPLPRDWQLLSVDDIKSPERWACVAGPFGSNISSKFFVDDGIPVIRGSNLRDDLTRFVPEGFVYVSEAQALTYPGQHVRGGDLVFTCWGTVGQVGLIPNNGPHPSYIISNKQLKLRPNQSVADSLYLFYFFASPEMVQYVRSRAIGAAVPGINLGILKALPIVLPPLATQRRIAALLSAHDDLIENCDRRIRVLDEMARALYREWFVLFRYPGHEKTPLVDSPLGRIPKGWRASPAKDLATVTYGFPFKSPLFSEEPDGRTPLVRIRDIPNGASSTYTNETTEPRYEIRDGDLLVGMDGDFHMAIWSNGRAYQNQRVARFRPTDAWATRHFFLALERPIQTLNASIVGTTVAHLGDAHIREIKLVEPVESVMSLARAAFGPIDREVAVLQQRTRNLRATRDLLLPRLLSGQLPAGDAT
jgi:type I restriction enzyme S subunit